MSKEKRQTHYPDTRAEDDFEKSFEANDEAAQELILKIENGEDILSLDPSFDKENINLNYQDTKGRTAMFVAAKFNRIHAIPTLAKWGADVNITDFKGKTPLFVAAQKGNVGAIEILGYCHAFPNLVNKNGFSPIYAATQEGHVEAIKALKAIGGDVNLQSSLGFTAISLAANLGNADIIRTLHDLGAHVNLPDNALNTPLHHAVRKDNKKYPAITKATIKVLLELGAQHDVKNMKGETPTQIVNKHHNPDVAAILNDVIQRDDKIADVNDKIVIEGDETYSIFIAASTGDVNLIKFLTNGGAHLNVFNSLGRTPVHEAAIYDKGNSIETLYSLGAHVHLLDEDGYSAMHLAALNNSLDAIQALRDVGVDLNVRGQISSTPIHIAAMHNQGDAIKKLHGLGANINLLDEYGFTAMHVAAVYGKPQAIGVLSKLGVDINVRTLAEMTPMHLAVDDPDNIITVRILAKRQADIHAKDYTGRTPFYIAVQKNNLEAMKFLTTQGANINEADNSGRTPLFRATLQTNIETMKFLHQQGANFNVPEIEDDCVEEKALTINTIKAMMENFEAVCRRIDEGTAYDAIFSRVKQLLKNDELKTFISDNDNLLGELIVKSYADFAIWMTYARNSSQSVTRVNNTALKASENALFEAISQGQEDVSHLLNHDLIASGEIDINSLNEEEETLIFCAAKHGNISALKLLIEYGAAVNTASKLGLTPVIIAAFQGNAEVIEILHDAGANIDTTMQTGDSAVFTALRCGHNKVLESLIARGANIHITNNNGSTPLFAATFHGHNEAIKLLLRSGADINTANKDGITPLFQAALKELPETLTLLISQGADSTDLKKKGVGLNFSEAIAQGEELLAIRLESEKTAMEQITQILQSRIHLELPRAANPNEITTISECISQFDNSLCLEEETNKSVSQPALEAHTAKLLERIDSGDVLVTEKFKYFLSEMELRKNPASNISKPSAKTFIKEGEKKVVSTRLNM